MLILTRRANESVKIGGKGDGLEGPVTVTVLGIKGGQVRIGIEAQRDIRVDRDEVRKRIDRETVTLAAPLEGHG